MFRVLYTGRLILAGLFLIPLLSAALVGCNCNCGGETKTSARNVAFEESEAKAAPAAVGKASWPMYGGTNQRNMANTTEKNIPESWAIGEEPKDYKNIKWAIDLGTEAYGGPVVAGGKIFVGTNNGKPRDPKIDGDKGVLMCFREADGGFLWQAVFEKLDETIDTLDNPNTGIVSVPVVEGERLYFVNNRCEVICADVEGDPKNQTAKILWKLDMIKDLGVLPRAASACSPLIIGDLLYVVTGNGLLYKANVLKTPDAPSFIAINKTTGKVVWKSDAPGKNILEGQWNNPVAAEVKGKKQVIFPGGDGWLYGFEPLKGELLWKFDCNPKAAIFKGGGRGDRGYPMATPVVYEDRLYASVGVDPSDGPGVGHLWCIDLTKEPKNKDKDLSQVGDNFDPKADVNKDSGLVWHYGGLIKPKPARGREFVFGRTISTVAIHEGLLYAVDLDGYFHCLDAKTGEKHWEHDLKDGVWASPYYVDGKVFLGTEGGNMFVFKHGKEKKLLGKIDMVKSLQLPAVAVNGVLYVNTGTQLFAIEKK